MVGVEPLEPGSACLDAVAQPKYVIPVCKVGPTSSPGAGRSLLPLYLHSLMQLLLPTYPWGRSIDSRRVCLIASLHRNTWSSNSFSDLGLLDYIYISSPRHKVAEIDAGYSWRKVMSEDVNTLSFSWLEKRIRADIRH